MRRWRSVYKAHLGEHFGLLCLKDITEQEVRVFRRKLREVKGLHEQTVNIAVKTLCQSLRRALKEGLITSNPCEDIRPLKSRKTQISPFTFQELTHLIETATVKAPELTDMLILWSRTGLRTGEIFGLKWEDVDYFNRLLHIRRTMHVAGREGDPKTERSERSLPLRKPAIEALKRQEARTALRRSYVFLNKKGAAIRSTTWREKWMHLLRLAGLSYRSPKQMRHTFATLHLAAGESVSWVYRMLGHSSAKVTFDFYNCYVPNLTRDDGSAFDRFMESENGNNLVTNGAKLLK
jgi:integrase